MVIVHKIEKRIDLVFASIVLALYNIVILVLIIVIFNETFTNMGLWRTIKAGFSYLKTIFVKKEDRWYYRLNKNNK